jgi:hypothetical protein
MKKLVYLFLALLLAFAFVGCKDDDPDNTTTTTTTTQLTLDQRLVGKWYNIQPTVESNENTKYELKLEYNGGFTVLYSDGYYEFIKTGDNYFFSSDSIEINDIYANDINDTAVYSKDGIIYWKLNNQKIISYMFHNTFPYSESEYPLGSQRSSYNNIAAAGNLFTYSLFNQNGSLYNKDININGEWFMFKLPIYEP